MEVVVLGSGTAVPRARRAAAGLLLLAAGDALLLDASAGTLTRAARAGARFERLGAVLLTHLHPDHCGELVPLLFALRSREAPERTRPLRVVGPPGLRALVDGLRGVYGKWVEPPAPPRVGAEIVEIAPGGVVQGDGWSARAFEVEHLATSLAWRVEAEGRAFVYSGDSSYCEGLVAAVRGGAPDRHATPATSTPTSTRTSTSHEHEHENADARRGCDLFVCECSFADPHDGRTHLSPAWVARVAREGGARRVVLTHFYPSADAAERDAAAAVRAAGYDGEVVAAEDGLRFPA